MTMETTTAEMPVARFNRISFSFGWTRPESPSTSVAGMPRPCQEGPGSADLPLPPVETRLHQPELQAAFILLLTLPFTGRYAAPGDDEVSMAKSPEEGMASLIQNLEAKTGKSIDDWVEIARRRRSVEAQGNRRDPQAEHGLTHGYANQIAMRRWRRRMPPRPGSTDLVDAQYAGCEGRALHRSTTHWWRPCGRLAPTSNSRPRRPT